MANVYKGLLGKWYDLDGDYMTLELDRAAFEELRALLRRDWAVRVLDAHLATGGEVDIAEIGDGRVKSGQWDIEIHDALGQFTHAFTEPTPDEARHAAALAVFPTLSDAKRAELGECP